MHLSHAPRAETQRRALEGDVKDGLVHSLEDNPPDGILLKVVRE